MLEPDFYIGRKGRITNGEYIGWTVKVADDSAGETGGYYILLTDNSGGFDDWLEHKHNIPLYFADTDWVIEWQ